MSDDEKMAELEETIKNYTKEIEAIAQEKQATENNSVMAKVQEDQHDQEVDEIKQKALKAFSDIMVVGSNVSPERSARVFEVAGQFLRTSLDAANSKVDKQLKAAKLKIEAAKLRANEEMLGQISSGKEVMADRNEILKQMMNEGKEQIVDVEPQEADPGEDITNSSK